jgi:coniferyl-aldehyde dehydrogenase
MIADNPVSADSTISSLLAEALRRQRGAYLAQPVPSLAEREADLQALARFVRENKAALTAAVNADYGHRSTHETLLIEIGPVLAAIRHALRHARAWMRPQRRAIDRLTYGLGRNEVIPQPLGVVGVIVPWNFPLFLSLGPLVSILAAGNRAMVKMSESSRHLARLLIERTPAYFAPEKLQFFDETGGVGIEFSRLPFDHLLFTGSGATGRAVMAAAAQNLCPVTLELGGKAPAIVCDDFDLRLAAERISMVKYLNAGQICTTVDYAFVPHAKIGAFAQLVRESVSRRYTGLDSPDYSSIIDRRAYDRLVGALEDARARSAKVIPLLSGASLDAERHRIAPHLVLDAPPDSEIMQREIFGPILPLVAYRRLEEVIDRINAGPRPLALYPFSNRRHVVDRLIAHVMSGGVTVNDALMHVGQDDLPFGGVGESGMGHYHGREGFNTFSKLRPVFRQACWSTATLLAPPYGKLADRLIAFLAR